ncbi:RNA-binding S4 domain-containing protein [Vibrio sp. 99-8-1]|uniref:RNA-binding S4 domain-containing protein n=1 Tax=Vibrio sp. 99-8-1 TaxID=2607602 RepID=UPI0014934619|nr:RNA-binding S4 domain-containing protein [Vibrio sp. 99-8-1]
MNFEQSNSSDQEEIEIEAIAVEISNEPVELYKVFKIANLVNGGGEAKHIIAEGYVAVNGEIETRKRRKMYDGDLIEFNQEYYVVICVEGMEQQYDMDELPEIDENDLTAEEFQVSAEEAEAINQQYDTSEDIQSDSVEEQQSEQDNPEQENKPSKGRKSIQFF